MTDRITHICVITDKEKQDKNVWELPFFFCDSFVQRYLCSHILGLTGSKNVNYLSYILNTV